MIAARWRVARVGLREVVREAKRWERRVGEVGSGVEDRGDGGDGREEVRGREEGRGGIEPGPRWSVGKSVAPECGGATPGVHADAWGVVSLVGDLIVGERHVLLLVEGDIDRCVDG